MDEDPSNSLFEGMEFVDETVFESSVSDDILSAPTNVPKESETVSGTTAAEQGSTEPLQESPGRGALDADLFSSMDLQQPLDLESPTVNGSDPPSSNSIPAAKARQSITDSDSKPPAGNPIIVDPSVPSEAVPAPAVRKKKKSIRVGYARDGGELSVTLDELYAAGTRGDLNQTSTEAPPSDVPANSTSAHSTASEIIVAKEEEGTTLDLDHEKGTISHSSRSAQEQVTEEPATGLEVDEGEELREDTDNTGASEPLAQEDSTESGVEEERRELTQADQLQLRLKEVLNEKEASLVKVQQRLRELVVARKGMVQRKREAAQALAKSLAELVKSEVEVAEACEREDFEAADSLSQQAEELQRDADGARVAARFAEEECVNLMAEIQSLAKQEVVIDLDAVRSLEAIMKEATELSDKAEKESSEKAQEELERVLVEEETLEVKKRKVALEQRVLDEQDAELAAKVDNLTEPERQEKEKLLNETQGLEKELEALLELVREKEAEIAVQGEKISAVDTKIATVAARFDKVRAEIDGERARVAKMSSEVQQQEEALVQAKRDVERVKERAKKEGESLGRVVSEAEDVIKGVKEGAEEKRRAVEEGESLRRIMRELAEEEKTNTKDAQEIQDSAAQLKQEEQELAVKVSKLQQEAASVAQRLALAKRRLPELEAEKKQAAAARNFKEAAKLAAEAKLLANDKVAALEEDKAVTAELSSVEKLHAVKIEEISQIESMTEERRHAAALARCARLWLEAGQVRKEMEAAAETEDFEEAESLRLEAEAADKEMEDLCNLHEIRKEEVEALAEGNPLNTPADG